MNLKFNDYMFAHLSIMLQIDAHQTEAKRIHAKIDNRLTKLATPVELWKLFSLSRKNKKLFADAHSALNGARETINDI